MSSIPPSVPQTPISSIHVTDTTSDTTKALPYDPAKAALEGTIGDFVPGNVPESLLGGSLLVPEECTKLSHTDKELSQAVHALTLDAIRVGITLQKKSP